MFVEVFSVKMVTAEGYEVEVKREGSGTIRRYMIYPDIISVWEDNRWMVLKGRGVKLSDLKTDDGRRKRVQKFFATK